MIDNGSWADDETADMKVFVDACVIAGAYPTSARIRRYSEKRDQYFLLRFPGMNEDQILSKAQRLYRKAKSEQRVKELKKQLDEEEGDK